MNRCYIDTNVLISYKDEDAPLFGESADLLRHLMEQQYELVVSSLIMDEFLHVANIIFNRKGAARHNHYERLVRLVQDIFLLPLFTVMTVPVTREATLQAVSFMEQFHLKPRDAYHLVTMRAHGITHFATFDNDFKTVFKKGLLTRVFVMK